MTIAAALIAISFLQFFEARNQVANFVITPPPEGTSVKPEFPNLEVRDTCPGCEGKGELVAEEPDYGQSKGRIGQPKKLKTQCPLCNGKGKIQAFMNQSELMRQIATDRAAFAAEHQGKGEIAVGEAFVPNAKYSEMSKDQRKLVEEAFGHPCKKCNWTGLEPCKKCDGNGTVRCTNSDCKGGWQVVKTTSESSISTSGGTIGGSRSSTRSSGRRTSKKESNVKVSPCPVCGGAKFTVCPDCGGRRAKPCAKCNGLGIKKKGSL